MPGNVAFVSIVGKYRTGKSFLQNRIMGLNGGKGFKVSSSTNACTKGLWVWTKPIFNEKDNLNIFFIDCEGLSSVDSNNSMDHRIFSLTVLISSFFIYNQIGAIDENSISSLSIVTQIIKSVAIREGEKIESEYQLSQFAP